MSIEELYQDPGLFEAENALMMHDVDFWKTIISRYGSKNVLEIGCGTGRIARQIIDSIDNYTGIDISESFLCFFKSSECFKENAQKISLKKIDVSEYETETAFDLIMLTSQFPGHIYNNLDFNNILKKIRSMLTINGKIVIDYCNPDIRFLENHEKYQFCYEFPYNGIIQVFEKNTYSQMEQINYEYRKYIMPDKTELLQTIPFRIYFPQELDSLIALSGLHIDKKFGNYDGSEYKEYCEKQLYIISRE